MFKNIYQRYAGDIVLVKIVIEIITQWIYNNN